MKTRAGAAGAAWLLAAVYYFYQYSLRSAPAVMMPQLSGAFGLSALGAASLVGLFYYGYATFSLVAAISRSRDAPAKSPALARPALLMSNSISPNSWMRRTTDASPGSVVRSAAKGSIRPLCVEACLASSSSRSRRRATASTGWPRRPSTLANSQPLPEACRPSLSKHKAQWVTKAPNSGELISRYIVSATGLSRFLGGNSTPYPSRSDRKQNRATL